MQVSWACRNLEAQPGLVNMYIPRGNNKYKTLAQPEKERIERIRLAPSGLFSPRDSSNVEYRGYSDMAAIRAKGAYVVEKECARPNIICIYRLVRKEKSL